MKKIIAKNIANYRKSANLTQLELAEKLNYSDKAISKWERAETVPDIFVLKNIADIFQISVNDLIHEQKKSYIIAKKLVRNKLFVSLLSTSLVWVIASVLFMILTLLTVKNAYFSFIYAFPISFLLLTIFSALWFRRRICAVMSSLFVWSIAISIYFSILSADIWTLFIIAVTVQISIVLWFVYRHIKIKKIND